MFQNNNNSDVWAQMTWQDDGSRLILPNVTGEEEALYGTTISLSQELERQSLVLRFSPNKELKNPICT